MLSYFLALIVGIVYLLTGFVKVINSQPFFSHIAKLHLVPGKLILQVAFLAAAFEVVLGASIILFTFPQWVIPFTVFLLICFIILTYWSTSTGKVEDCGCYGGLLAIKPTTSIFLDVVYIAFLVASYMTLDENYSTEIWQWIPLIVIFILSYFLAKKSLRKALIDLSRLKAGKKWKKNWIKNSNNDLRSNKHFIVFLGKTCPYCKRWVPLMNIMNTQKDLPSVLGVMALTDKEISEFKEEYLVRFPVVSMDKILWNTMINAVPTAISLENGFIKEKWEGQLPEQYAERIKQFLESISIKQPKSAFSG